MAQEKEEKEETLLMLIEGEDTDEKTLKMLTVRNESDNGDA